MEEICGVTKKISQNLVKALEREIDKIQKMDYPNGIYDDDASARGWLTHSIKRPSLKEAAIAPPSFNLDEVGKHLETEVKEARQTGDITRMQRVLEGIGRLAESMTRAMREAGEGAMREAKKGK